MIKAHDYHSLAFLDVPTTTLPNLMGDYWNLMLSFVFLYPISMSILWMVGSFIFYLRYEIKPHRIVSQPPVREHYPRIAILVPCFNEQDNVNETIGALMDLDYPDFEVIAINDGSKDNTGPLLDQLTQKYQRLRVVHQIKNQGKAVGLNTAAMLTDATILVGIDGDARLDKHCLHWLVRHFDDPQVGAVTGNPRVRTRSTLLGKLQVGEFSSIIGLIKRAQRANNMLFTISGVIAAFRRSALVDVGMWSPDKLTEDVDITWKLQITGWEVRFEPRALCWILMPETLSGLWKQRLRWATGGTQVIFDYWSSIWRQPRMWILLTEYFTSLVWASCMAILIIYRLLDIAAVHADLDSAPILMLGWAGILLASVFLIQTLFSLWLDHPYDQKLFKVFFWMIWYPLVYWVLNATTSIVALPKAAMRRSGRRARWTSPDRGINPN